MDQNSNHVHNIIKFFCLPVEIVGLNVGCQLRFPFVPVVQQFFLIVQQFFVRFSGELKIRSLVVVSISHFQAF